MKASKALTLLMVSMMIFLLLVPAAYAQKQKGQKEKGKTELGLTQEQKEKIRSARLEFQKEKIRLKADLKIAKLELRSLMADEKADKATIFQKIEEIGTLRTRLAKSQVEQKLALRDILTKEQRDKLKELRFKKAARKRLLERGMRDRRQRQQVRPFMEAPRIRGEMPSLPQEPFFETAELAEEAELVQILDELELAEPAALMLDEPELAEPAPLVEEMELLPLLDDELSPLPEEPEIEP